MSGSRRIVLALALTAVLLGLLFRYPTSRGRGALPTGSVAVAAGPAAVAGRTGGTTSGATTAGKTYAGSVADTRWGPVQVQITVVAGKITTAGVLQVPNGNGRDAEINSVAVPILNSEVLAAQNAQIDVVSGATVTSDGYLSSLQAALDAAGR